MRSTRADSSLQGPPRAVTDVLLADEAVPMTSLSSDDLSPAEVRAQVSIELRKQLLEGRELRIHARVVHDAPGPVRLQMRDDRAPVDVAGDDEIVGRRIGASGEQVHARDVGSVM